jgi:cyclopropane-fatty-acyl-phospholipid synthase
MLEKQLLHTALSGIRHGELDVTYWDGTTKRYGSGKPRVAVTFKDPTIIKAMRKDLDLAVGEAYMNGRIDVRGDLADLARLGDENQAALGKYLRKLQRPGRRTSKRTNFSDVQHHYDLGNDFYRLWLDKSLTYSCAYFRKPSDSLETAQRQKVDHILKKLGLKKDMRLLDIGSGWGELIIRAAKRYGVRAHGITLSKEQYRATRKRIIDEKLTGRVTVELKHYEDLKGSERFDRIVSVGMYEHVGKDNHAKYMAVVDRLLRSGGITLLHTITQFEDREMNIWTDKYIFPGGYLPTLQSAITELADKGFRTVDVESLRRHYARTLDEWSKRFERQVVKVTEMYDERFVRMWRLYLRGSYAGFAFGNLDIVQILATKGLSDEVPMTREYQYGSRR